MNQIVIRYQSSGNERELNIHTRTVSTQFSSIRPIDRIPSGATSPSQSGPASNGNEGALLIFQRYRITGTSPSDCLVSYPGHLLLEVLLLYRDAVGAFYSSSRLGNILLKT